MSTVEPDALRALAARAPSSVCVVTVDAGGQKLGLTVGTLVALSLDPPLVGFSVSRDAALHELLAAGQEWLAQHFARGVPPIAMWHGVSTSEGSAGAPRLVGALGWLDCRLEHELTTGTHRSEEHTSELQSP